MEWSLIKQQRSKKRKDFGYICFYFFKHVNDESITNVSNTRIRTITHIYTLGSFPFSLHDVWDSNRLLKSTSPSISSFFRTWNIVWNCVYVQICKWGWFPLYFFLLDFYFLWFRLIFLYRIRDIHCISMKKGFLVWRNGQIIILFSDYKVVFWFLHSDSVAYDVIISISNTLPLIMPQIKATLELDV